MSSKRICVALPKELLETLDGIAKEKSKTRTALLREAAQQYTEDLKLKGVRKFLREWPDEEVAGWLKEDKRSEKIVRTVRAKRAG